MELNFIQAYGVMGYSMGVSLALACAGVGIAYWRAGRGRWRAAFFVCGAVCLSGAGIGRPTLAGSHGDTALFAHGGAGRGAVRLGLSAFRGLPRGRMRQAAPEIKPKINEVRK